MRDRGRVVSAGVAERSSWSAGETEGDLGVGGDDAWSVAAHACMLGASSNLRLTAAQCKVIKRW